MTALPGLLAPLSANTLRHRRTRVRDETLTLAHLLKPAEQEAAA